MSVESKARQMIQNTKEFLEKNRSQGCTLSRGVRARYIFDPAVNNIHDKTGKNNVL